MATTMIFVLLFSGCQWQHLFCGCQWKHQSSKSFCLWLPVETPITLVLFLLLPVETPIIIVLSFLLASGDTNHLVSFLKMLFPLDSMLDPFFFCRLSSGETDRDPVGVWFWLELLKPSCCDGGSVSGPAAIFFVCNNDVTHVIGASQYMNYVFIIYQSIANLITKISSWNCIIIHFAECT